MSGYHFVALILTICIPFYVFAIFAYRPRPESYYRTNPDRYLLKRPDLFRLAIFYLVLSTAGAILFWWAG